MSAFKDMVAADVKRVFLNGDEFAETHTVNGKTMCVMLNSIDNDERSKSMKSHMDGIHARLVVMHVAAEDFGTLPPQGDIVSLNRRRYKVVDAYDEFGMYEIVLEANKSR